MKVLKKILNSEKTQEYKDLARNYVFENKNYISIGLGLARSVTNFATNKNPLSFIEGGFNMLTSIAQLGNTNANEFFSEKRGWEVFLTSSWQEKPMLDIFSSLLENYPKEPINYGTMMASQTDAIFHLPIADIGICNGEVMYYKSRANSYEEIYGWFLKEKMKELDSKFYSLVAKKTKTGRYYWETKSNFTLCSDHPEIIDSKYSKEYTAYIKSFLDAGLNRSIIFLGQPGTGKTTVINTILKNLNLSSFRFKYDSYEIDLNSVKSLLLALKIEALIIDDFEQAGNTPLLLEFLEWGNRNLKVILASSNSLKTVHPAIIRPGRFAEVIELNEVDDDLLKLVLKDHYYLFADKVRKWPIAYINELISRLSIHKDLDQDVVVKELDDRVLAAIALLKA